MKKSEVRGPKSDVRSPKRNAKTTSWARSNVDSGEFSARPRTADLGPRTSLPSDFGLRALIVGYGNPLRSDDALGGHASRLLADALAGRDVEVITCHQLTPELAEPLSRCRRAVFIDADAEGTPGEVHRRTVRPQAPTSSSFTHTCTPSSLLASAKQLYGRRPQAIVVTVTAQSFEFGDTLSPVVSAALPEVVALICRWVGKN